MLKTKDIIDEKDKILRKKSKEVTFPMDEKDKENIRLMVEYLKNSQIDELAAKYSLRPGMGMSAVQIGVLKRYITIVHESSEGHFDIYVVINPKITSESKEKVYVEDGEECLSINRVTVEGFDTEGNPITIRAREELAIVFQHEIDHLNGILFIDRIDPKNPFKYKDTYRAI